MKDKEKSRIVSIDDPYSEEEWGDDDERLIKTWNDL